MASRKWNNSSQYKKINKSQPWLLATKPTSCDERHSGQESKPKETLCPGIFTKLNYQHAIYPQNTSSNNPAYMQRPTTVYRQDAGFHPYNKTTHRHISNKYSYKLTGSQYSVVKNVYKWINPNMQKKEEEDKKEKEDTSCTESSVASSSSGESS